MLDAKAFGYTRRRDYNRYNMREPPEGFRVCHAGTRVPCLKDPGVSTKNIVYHSGVWTTPVRTDIALTDPNVCAAWPSNYCPIATDLPGYGNQDFTHVDEGGVV